MSDKINPDHYKHGGIETIAYIKAKMSKDEFYGYLKGNALKYVSREGHKGESHHDSLDDIGKAEWYLAEMKLFHVTAISVLEAKLKEDEWIDDSLHDED